MKKKILISLLFGGLFLWLALKGVNWTEVRASFATIDWAPLAGVPFLMVATHWFRARRWRLLLRPIREIRVWDLFAMNAVGFLTINVLPLRLGEVTRPLLLKRRYDIPFTSGLATVAIERVFDGLVTALILGVGIASLPAGVEELPLLKVGIHTAAILMLSIFVGVLAFLVLAVFQQARALKLLEFFTGALPVRARTPILRAGENFMAGLKSLPDLKSLVGILVESLGVWVTPVLSYWLIIQAFGLDLPWGAPFAILGVTMVGLTLPSAPGFVGTFQLFVEAGLALYGVSKAIGFAFSIVAHASAFLTVVILGLAFLPSVTGGEKLISEVARRGDAAAS